MSFSIEKDIQPHLPKHWELRRLKEVADVIPSNVDKLSVEGQKDVLLCNYVDTYKNDRITSSIDFMKATATPAQIERLSLAKGDVTITKDSETPWDIAVPAYIAEEIEGLVCGYHLSKISPIQGRIDGGFLAWVLRCKSINLQFALISQGVTRYGLGSSALADGRIPCPPFAEQIAIAAYLDAETARIDMLIEGKEQLQSLLQELKHSTLTKAIHEGLEPDAPMNDSGVSWFSKLPSHWAPMRLKRVIDGIENGWSPQCEGEPAAPGQWGVLKAGACNGGVFRVEENKALPSNESPRPELEIKPGNVLMSRASGSLDLVGSVAFVEDVPTGLMLSDKIFRLKIDDEEVCGEWLALALNSSPMRRQIASFVGGAEGLARNIASGNIRELVLPVPPRKEQVEIVHAVKRDLARIAELVHHVDEELEVLKELRSVTITDAVLGRIDVRKAKNN